MAKTDERRQQLAALWRDDRGEFLAEYRRVLGESAGREGKMTAASMIDRIVEREAAERHTHR